ncbi:MAG: metallophosphoesterase [Candidatus Saganbacteria bacterium]|nr:metallophosphoesterase [Candidatus Saganbacteria bacterium]
MICHNKIKNLKSKIPTWKNFIIIIIALLGFGILSLGFLGGVAWAEGFSFVVFGDPQGRNDTFSDLIQKVNREKEVSFAICVGDLVEDGKRSDYLEYIKTVSTLKPKLYNVIGNHDAQKSGWKYFEEFFGPTYYAFDYDNSHFILLDNAFGESFTPKQYQWLKNDLKENQGKNIFVFFHRPIFDPAEIVEGYLMSPKQIAQELEALFYRYRVKYVFAGHLHTYARAERDGVTYIVTGGGGAPLHMPEMFGGYYHYVRVDVNGDKIKDRVVRIYE